MLFGILNQKKPKCLPEERGYTLELWEELGDLFEGGYQILEKAKEYLPKSINESEQRYQERLRLASYIGYFGQIVNNYTSTIFGDTVSVLPAGDADNPYTPGELPESEIYAAFGKNADLKGCSFGQLFAACGRTALVKGKCLIAIDFPADPGVPVGTRADSKRLGLDRPYAYELPIEQAIDWEYDEVIRRRVSVGEDHAVDFEIGRFSFLITKRVISRRESPYSSRGAAVIEFKIWTKRPDDGRVVWELYRSKPLKDGQEPKDDDDIPRVAYGETEFTEIPIVEIRIPSTLWIGNVIGPMVLEHWQRRSALLAAQQRAMLVVPVVYLGPEIHAVDAALPAEVQQNPARDKDVREAYERGGWSVLGKEDRLAFESAPTDAFEIVDKQLKDLVDEIHRVTGRMASSISSTSKALSRSGLSKRADNADFITVCMALAEIFKDAAARAYTIISRARGEVVEWTVHGLSDYKIEEDPNGVAEEATTVKSIGIESKTFRVEYFTRKALQLLPGLSPQTQAQIRAEIDAGTVAEGAAPPDDEDDEDDGDGEDAEPPSEREPVKREDEAA